VSLKVSHVWVLFVAICNINQIMLTSVNSTTFASLSGKMCGFFFNKKLKINKSDINIFGE
jgi:hypothetical protein